MLLKVDGRKRVISNYRFKSMKSLFYLYLYFYTIEFVTIISQPSKSQFTIFGEDII
jgi:hypothetical protein